MKSHCTKAERENLVTSDDRPTVYPNANTEMILGSMSDFEGHNRAQDGQRHVGDFLRVTRVHFRNPAGHHVGVTYSLNLVKHVSGLNVIGKATGTLSFNLKK